VSQQFSGVDAEITNTIGTPAFLPPEAVSGKEDKFLVSSWECRKYPTSFFQLGFELVKGVTSQIVSIIF